MCLEDEEEVEVAEAEVVVVRLLRGDKARGSGDDGGCFCRVS